MGDSLARFLRGTRLSLDLTIEELARASGVAERTIGDIERGVVTGPRRRTVEALADGLGLSSSDRATLLQVAQHGRVGPSLSSVPTVVAGGPPARLSDFVGRQDTVDAIAAVVRAASGDQLTTVVVAGAPGFGKTTVAIEALARTDVDVVVFASLGGTSATPRLGVDVVRGLVQQLGERDQPIPRDLVEASGQWAAATSDRRVAVVLDDAADESQVRPVLAALGPVVAVVTSRRSLAGLDDVTRIGLEPFDDAESAALLERVVPVSQWDAAALAELAALCGHVPLALRIAGNRLASRPQWTVGDLVERLRDERARIGNLAVGDRAVESAFALSYDQLDERSRRLFRRLSIIDGPTFHPALVASFAGCDARSAEDTLDALADLGLVQPLTGGRFRLHDLLRVFAADRLRHDEGEAEAAALRRTLHGWLLERTVAAGAWFEDTADADADAAATAQTDAGPAGTGRSDRAFGDRAAAAAWLRAEAGHWSAAHAAAVLAGAHDTVVATAESLHWFSDTWPEWGQWYEVFLRSVGSARALGRPAVLARQLGYLAWAELVERTDPVAATLTADLAVAAAEESGDPLELGWAWYYAQWAAMARRDLAAALAATRATEVLADSDHDELLLNAMRIRAEALSLLGEHEQSLHEHLATLTRAEQTSAADPNRTSSEIVALLTRASVAREMLSLGDHEGAIDWATVLIERCGRIDHRLLLAKGLAIRALALEASGRPADAVRDARAALDVHAGEAALRSTQDAQGVLDRLGGRPATDPPADAILWDQV